MDYAGMLAELYGLRRLGVKLELDRMRDAARAVGVADWSSVPVPVVQVGGTNGKGSTCAFLEACLREAGVRVGLFTSPHLSRFTERFRVAGREVAPEVVARLYADARARVAPGLTFFEWAALLALMAFREAAVDAVILEVGLGGRFDATTAIDADVAVVTGVAMDHQVFLGDTIEAIAAEKGAIFRAGRPAVVGEGDLLRDIARARGARLVPLPDVPAGWVLGLRGAHQRRNAACALAALDALEPRVVVDAAARRRGLEGVRWPARMERVEHDGVAVWLDAAHNPDGARALAAAMPAGAGLVFAVASDKAADEMLAALGPRAGWLIATEGTTRARPAADIGTLAADACPDVAVDADWRRALATGLDRARRERVDLVVAGSLFLVGAVRAHLLGETEDPIVAQDPGPPGNLASGPGGT